MNLSFLHLPAVVQSTQYRLFCVIGSILEAGAIAPTDARRWRGQWPSGQAFIFLLHVAGFTAPVRAVVNKSGDAQCPGNKGHA